VAIIDPGPTSCLETLELGLQANGIRWPDVRHILLTHIHLDHAGSTGTIVREHPHITVLVHERGLKHMADPTKLIDSATRIYRDRMDELWGEFAAVPTKNMVSLAGGERIEAGGRAFDVAYTPGHASHHVSYFDGSSGVAFVGDTAGVCINSGFVLPPTPPPDIDVAAWHASVARILEWQPETLFLTHFGPVTGVAAHLGELLDRLKVMQDLATGLLADPGLSEDERERRFVEQLRRIFRQQLAEVELRRLELGVPFGMCWGGLARALRKA
jgi:glyoxylase-like metal-dependent hydrolase (beta-lactamase superfamily II)